MKSISEYRQFFFLSAPEEIWAYLENCYQDEIEVIQEHFGIRDCNPEFCLEMRRELQRKESAWARGDIYTSPLLEGTQPCKCMGNISDQLLLDCTANSIILKRLFPNTYRDSKIYVKLHKSDISEDVYKYFTTTGNGKLISKSYNYKPSEEELESDEYETVTLTGPNNYKAQVKLRKLRWYWLRLSHL